MSTSMARSARSVRVAATFAVAFGLVGLSAADARADATIVDTSPGTKDFGTLYANTTAFQDITITLRNTGNQDTSSLSFGISGANSGDFTIQGAEPTTIVGKPQADCDGNWPDCEATITIRFAPTAAGTRDAQLDILWAPPAASSLAIPLTGVGLVEPNIVLTPAGANDFGARSISAGASATHDVTITNDGNVILNVTGVSKGVSSDCDHFTLTSAEGQNFKVLAPGQLSTGADEVSSALIQIAFDPSARGTFSCDITITNDDPDGNEVFTVTGTGEGSQLSIPGGTLAFNPTRVGDTDGPLTFTLSNVGEEALNVSDISIATLDNDEDYLISPSSGMIAAGGSLVVNVTFQPQALGDQNATIDITSDADINPTGIKLVSGRGVERRIALNPTSIDVGPVVVGGDAIGSLDIQNSGEATLTVTDISLFGGDAARFSITSTTPPPDLQVSGGGNLGVSVRCSPTAVGSLLTTLSISSNADNAPANPTANVACTGVKPDILVDGDDPEVSPPPGITFAGTDVGQTSGVTTVVVGNANTATTSRLRVTTVTITGTHAADFAVTPVGPFNVNAGATRDLSVTFSPSAAGTRTAVMTINSDDQETPAVQISLTGDGQEPDITLVQPATTSIDFGDTLVGSNSGSTTVQIRNDGNKALQVSGASITSGAAQFSIVSGPSIPPTDSVAPGASLMWSLRCNPTTEGAKSGNFRISSDDPDTPTINISLACNGIESKLLVNPSPVDFPATRVCDTASPITVSIVNDGTADLTVNDISLSGSEFSISTAPPATPFTLTPSGTGGSTATMAIDFAPLNGGARTATLTIDSTDPSGLRSVSVQGVGLTNGLGVDKTTVAFGDVRIDQGAIQDTITITNTGTSSFTLSPPNVSNATDFTVTPVSPASLPATINGGQTATLRVDALPTTLGDKTGTITLVTDLPAPGCGPPVTVINLSASGIAPDMSISPSTLDMGGHDIHVTTPTTQSVTIMNTGTAPLNVSALSITGPDAAVFNLASSVTTPIDIPVGGSTAVAIEYLPTIERVGTDRDTATLNITSDAASGAMAMVTLNGQGIDRHISTDPASIMFPNTYRNPDEPVVRTFKVQNTGAAPLNISMALLGGDGAAAYTITQPTMSIAGGGEDTVTVSFNPTAGVDFDAFIDISNDDNDAPMRRVPITGAGVDPQLNIVPNGEIDLGVTGVGVAVTLSEKLPDGVQVVNMESDPFRVRELKLALPMGEDPVAMDMFEVRDFTPDTEIGALGTLPFDMVFSPDRPGVFRIVVEVYVNSDPLRVTYVTFKGEAVEVQVRGGGCSATPGRSTGTGAGLVVVLMLGLIVSRRRRLSSFARRGGSVVAVLLLCGALVAPQLASADPTRNLDIRNFRPMPEVESSMLSVQSAEVGASGAWALGVFLNHAANPLKVQSPQREGMNDAPITGRTAAELAFAYAFAGRFEAGALLSVVQQAGDDPTFSGLEAANGTAIGDLVLHGKAKLMSSKALSVAGAATITVPTASSDDFVGVDGPTVHARGLLGYRAGRIHFAANTGLRVRGSGELGDLEQGNELSYGLAASFRVQEKLFAIGEVFGAMGLGGGESKGVSPLEAAAGVRYRLSRQLGLATGAGRGILPGIGSPDFRAFLLVSYSPQAREMEPLYVPPPPKVVDRRDDDNDGIPNFKDKCPKEAEDKDGFEDDDGCPELDNDGDGIADAVDKCPTKPEDKDGFQDNDGCPDTDNDKDGVPDASDKCPNEPEDKDGFQDRDGCDDPDNDNDGIPDVIDQCALEPETINGKRDDDGCPDAGDSLVMVLPDRVEVYEQVRFARKTARITKKSHNVLGQVAATLRANRDFVRIRIAVHVHPRGAGDLALTKKRAVAVRQWLIKWGIEPERLSAKGFGSTRLLVPRKSKGAQGLNDRVEFIILEKRVKGAKKRGTGKLK